MKSGFIALNKLTGFSSNAAVVRLRHMLPKGTPVGHGGTLDPEASGVLPLCVGKATRLFDYIIDQGKEYETVLRLGQDRDTEDATGAVVAEQPVTAGEQEIRAVLKDFIGTIRQTPPMYSAIKRDGVRMYDLARKGEKVELEARSVRIDDIEYLGQVGPDGHRLRVLCHKGVYIRTLCRDIARAAGQLGYMESLDRTRAGAFTKAMCRTEAELRELYEAGKLEEALIDMDVPLAYLPEGRIPRRFEKLVRAGNPLRADEVVCNAPAGPVRLYLGDEFCGIGERAADGSVTFRCMLL